MQAGRMAVSPNWSCPRSWTRPPQKDSSALGRSSWFTRAYSPRGFAYSVGMARARIPSTAALRLLRAQGIDFEPRPYPYVDRGGAAAAAEALELELHTVIKTLVFETPDKQPLLVLMHGDRAVSTNQLARVLGVKQVRPCEPAVAERHTGYRVGGTSPFGTRRTMPVYVEASVLALPRIAINGGSRGLLVTLDPAVLTEQLGAEAVEVASSS